MAPAAAIWICVICQLHSNPLILTSLLFVIVNIFYLVYIFEFIFKGLYYNLTMIMEDDCDTLDPPRCVSYLQARDPSILSWNHCWNRYGIEEVRQNLASEFSSESTITVPSNASEKSVSKHFFVFVFYSNIPAFVTCLSSILVAVLKWTILVFSQRSHLIVVW